LGFFFTVEPPFPVLAAESLLFSVVQMWKETGTCPHIQLAGWDFNSGKVRFAFLMAPFIQFHLWVLGSKKKWVS